MVTYCKKVTVACVCERDAEENMHMECGWISCEGFFPEDLAQFKTNFSIGINVN
jgi:hypothetical protein